MADESPKERLLRLREETLLGGGEERIDGLRSELLDLEIVPSGLIGKDFTGPLTDDDHGFESLLRECEAGRAESQEKETHGRENKAGFLREVIPDPTRRVFFKKQVNEKRNKQGKAKTSSPCYPKRLSLRGLPALLVHHPNQGHVPNLLAAEVENGLSLGDMS